MANLTRPPAGERRSPLAAPAENARILYDELVRSRDRLAELPPLTALDVESVVQALHEVIWFFITPPAGAMTPLALPAEAKAQLVRAARSRDLDTYVIVTALLARKLAMQPRNHDLEAMHLTALNDALDALTFDHRRPKRNTLAVLQGIRADLEARITYVRAYRKSDYQFSTRPEIYSERKNKSERADQFFRRVYAAHVPRGLTQVDIRRVDPAFYNVLHVWCSRHKRRLSAFVPATRARRN